SRRSRLLARRRGRLLARRRSGLLTRRRSRLLTRRRRGRRRDRRRSARARVAQVELGVLAEFVGLSRHEAVDECPSGRGDQPQVKNGTGLLELVREAPDVVEVDVDGVAVLVRERQGVGLHITDRAQELVEEEVPAVLVITLRLEDPVAFVLVEPGCRGVLVV